MVDVLVTEAVSFVPLWMEPGKLNEAATICIYSTGRATPIAELRWKDVIAGAIDIVDGVVTAESVSVYGI